MPRVETLERPVKAPPRQRGRSSARGKKAPPPQDRLSQRTLFLRRVKRSLKPGLWILGATAVLVVGAELVRTLPGAKPHPAPPADAMLAAAPPAPAPVEQPGLLAEALAAIGFRIHHIEIHGAATIDPRALSAAVDVKTGDPTFGMSLARIQQRVDALGPVRDVTVERILPGTLVVDITERDVYAIWQTIQNGQPIFQLIDKNGDVIADQNAAAAKRRQPSLLLLSGADAPQQASTLIPELKAQPSVYAHVAAAERVDGLRWNLILKNHTVVKLPDGDEAAALAQLTKLQASMQLLDRPVEAIDLRQPGRLVVLPYTLPPPPPPPGKAPVKRQEGQ